MTHSRTFTDFLTPWMKVCAALPFLFMGYVPMGEAAGPHMMEPRVPTGQLEEARALVNPLPISSKVAEQGQSLYEGKGTCVNCHGVKGDGRGPGAATLNPPPRNFQHHGFWRHRTDGEIFWVIKHGSLGTAMIPFGGFLTDEEIWTIVRYVQTLPHGLEGPGGKGRRGGMGMAPHRNGPHHDQGGHAPCC